MKNKKDPSGVKSAIFSAIAILATIAVTLIFTSFKDRSETADTQTSVNSYSAYTPVGNADAPNLSGNESEVKNYHQDAKPPQNANVTVWGNPKYTNKELEMIAKTVLKEAGGCAGEEQDLVTWCILQRVDSGIWGSSIEDVVTYPYQFAYSANSPVKEEILTRVKAVAEKWARGEKPTTHPIYAPKAPYYYFEGDGLHNWFRENWKN